MPPKSTKNVFITKSVAKHGNQYDYDAVEYINNATHVNIKCRNCGKVNSITPNKHLAGRGCSNNHCKSLKQSIAQTFSKEKWIKIVKEFHEDKYDYTETDYTDSRLDVKIFCNNCKDYFIQNADSHRRGHGCQKCGGTKLLTQEEFVDRIKELNGDVFDYSLVRYTNLRTKVELKCNKCKRIFPTDSHTLVKHIINCPHCCSLSSEKTCREIFESIFHTTFNKVRPKFLKGLELDGYCEKLKLAFEYQGIQHYETVDIWKYDEERLKVQKERDQRKRDICASLGIDLVEVPYQYNFKDKLNMERFIRNELESERFGYLLMR